MNGYHQGEHDGGYNGGGYLLGGYHGVNGYCTIFVMEMDVMETCII